MFILINLKAYDTSATDIAAAAADVAPTTEARLAVAPPATAISAVAGSAPETWAQHVDGIEHGSHTGHTHPAHVAAAGATGTLLNHSERRLQLDQIERAIDAASAAGLESVGCANTPDQIAAVTALGPDAVAVEPPALIGSGTPVSQADPDIVTEAVAAARSVDPSVSVLCGAGIGSGEDVEAAADLGAEGVLLASGVATADEPAAVLADLVAPLE